MKWAALIAWVITAGGGFVLLAIWLSRGGMQQGREPGTKIRPPLIWREEHADRFVDALAATLRNETG
jgi:hypothetical protein